ncbi:hypothetical protein IQ07DRAFT_601010 [Pyrenochaeta sp. DS3sAY3a]|nr:hypothetical protein IQ07DRAFT_601010 [Pyrenochaeta sp. DS3sAY3a]
MTRPKTPTNAYQKEGKYKAGDRVWVLDGGRWWAGEVQKEAGSSGQNLKVEVTLDDGERRQTSVHKDDMRQHLALCLCKPIWNIEVAPCSYEMVLGPDGPRPCCEPSREPCEDTVEAKSMWRTIKAVTGHRAQHITTGKTPSVACVVAASAIQVAHPPGLESLLLAGVRPGPQRTSAIVTHPQFVNSQQPSRCGSTTAGSSADSRVDEAVTDLDDGEEERYLARSITGCLSEHEFQTSLPSPRWNAR